MTFFSPCDLIARHDAVHLNEPPFPSSWEHSQVTSTTMADTQPVKMVHAPINMPPRAHVALSFHLPLGSASVVVSEDLWNAGAMCKEALFLNDYQGQRPLTST